MIRYLVLLVLAGCPGPYLYQQSVAPPGRAARLDEVKGFWDQLKYYRLEVSRGVAVALTCRDGLPCEHVRAVSENPAIAEVRPASLGTLEKSYWGLDAHPASGLVVVAKAPGSTRVHVTAGDGRRDIAVTVIGSPDPTPAVATAHATPGT